MALSANMKIFPVTARPILATAWLVIGLSTHCIAQQAEQPQSTDGMFNVQRNSIVKQKARWGHWGNQPSKYSTWTNHSNRLVPVYTFGLTLNSLREEGSLYQDPSRIEKLYGSVPDGTVNPTALYFDQTDIYRLQVAAVDAGYSNIILMVFDGMDWQTTRAAAIYKRARVGYDQGRGTGLMFQDFRGMTTDFGFVVTSPYASGAKYDVNAQTMVSIEPKTTGGYDWRLGGHYPWHEKSQGGYLLGLNQDRPHSVTDSAASATSLTTGVKTYNGSINIDRDGNKLVPLARVLQDEQEFRVGVVTSVPISHATPAACYANNMTRKDYQDIARDMLGLPSSSHRREPLPGLDVVIGGGWGEGKKEDKLQGDNFMQGNPYLHQDDVRRSDLKNGGRYVVSQRTAGKSGREELLKAAQLAADNDHRLLGFYGTKGGHLPFQTADGAYNPTLDVRGPEKYTPQDISENPSLADMTEAALLVLEQAIDGFWLMIEAGDVDWANHSNNIDNSIGAVLSGDEAFRTVIRWVDDNNAWDYTAIIVTADHGHFMVIDSPDAIAESAK